MSRDPDELRARRREALTRQRRRRLLGGLLAVALVVAAAAIVLVVVGGGNGDDEGPAPEPEASLTPLSPSQMAGQRLIAGFDGAHVPKGLERMIASGRLAGVILFADNIESPAKTARTIASLQAIERPAGLEQPLAVMADQEGGAVRRIPGPPTASAAEMGRRGAGFAAAQGRATAAALLTYGVNIDLAPVLDVARPGSAIAGEGRSFGSDPNRIDRRRCRRLRRRPARGRRRRDREALPRPRCRNRQHRPRGPEHRRSAPPRSGRSTRRPSRPSRTPAGS